MKLGEFVAKFATKLEPWQQGLLVLIEKYDPKELELRMLDHMEGKPIMIGIDMANGPSKAAVCIAHMKGDVLIIDDIHESVEIRGDMMAAFEDQARTSTGVFRQESVSDDLLHKISDLINDDLVELGLRYEMPSKTQEQPVPDHDPHPKAKAKLPYFHQRRRY